ncbi:hypothetical protein B0H10DRAFT_2145086 [Mycena sp. CBHHK59/15]|nr:hypothetical protein B0H10DRAFT_2145086 [Mycena sp. CBHHK59/15]
MGKSKRRNRRPTEDPAGASKSQNTARMRARLAYLISGFPLFGALSAERDAIQKELSRLTYPILTLPVEITTEIFYHCLPISPEEPSPHRAPMLLVNVCRDWRNIAVSSHGLWSSFRIRFKYETWEISFSHLKTWLLRSGSHPLSLHLAQNNYSRVTDFESSDLMDEICEHSGRWSDMHLSLPWHSFVLLEKRLNRPLPSLRKLRLSGESVYEFLFPTTYASLSAFATAPALREVQIESLILPFLIPSGLPWAQLTTFKGMDFSANQCIRVLEIGSSIQDCTFRLTTAEVGFDPLLGLSSEALQLIAVQKLSLQGGYHTHQISLLNRLTLPNLHQLAVSFGPELNPSLLSFLDRSHCTLTSLKIVSEQGLNEEDFIRCIFMLPTLVDLDVTYSVSVGQSSRTFELLHSRNGLLPNLAALHVTTSGLMHSADFGILAEMLHSRSSSTTSDDLDSTAALYSFTLCLTRYTEVEPNVESVEILSALVAQGMHICIKGSSGLAVLL